MSAKWVHLSNEKFLSITSKKTINSIIHHDAGRKEPASEATGIVRNKNNTTISEQSKAILLSGQPIYVNVQQATN